MVVHTNLPNLMMSLGGSDLPFFLASGALPEFLLSGADGGDSDIIIVENTFLQLSEYFLILKFIVLPN